MAESVPRRVSGAFHQPQSTPVIKVIGLVQAAVLNEIADARGLGMILGKDDIFSLIVGLDRLVVCTHDTRG